MVQSLCTEFSPPLLELAPPESSTGLLSATPATYHAFPSPILLSQPEVAVKLRELGFGYRAEYVQRTAQMLCDAHGDPEKYLMTLRQLPLQDARTQLLLFHGVGPKVADCVLLMSLDKVKVILPSW